MASIQIDEKKCTLCGQCVEGCPFSAIEEKQGKIEINASCKTCKLCIKKCPEGAISLVQTPRASVDKHLWSGIMVFVEIEGGHIHPVVFELIGKARALAEKAGFEVYGVMPCAEKTGDGFAKTLLEYGIDKLCIYEHEALENFRADVYTNVLEDCIRWIHPSVILVGATSMGRSLAPRVATRFKTGLTADCTQLEIKDNTDLVQIRPAFGGNIMAQIVTANTRPQLATVRYKVMDRAKKVSEIRGEAIYREVSDKMLASGIEVLYSEPIQHEKGIEEEEVLVVAGRGIKSREDLEMLQTLADSLGGQLAATRPLIENGWVHYTKQIGLSGRTVKPKLMITCGVSGAIQFRAGMAGAECIVAINADAKAPIFDIANICITDDLYEVIPKLNAMILDKGATV